jgi:hypothetical protein
MVARRDPVQASRDGCRKSILPRNFVGQNEVMESSIEGRGKN